ncbi:hypothetical protein Tco_1493720 [Tanacetum coccineum]
MAEQDIPPPTITAMKIPIIRKGEYDIWSMRMRQYICHTDHNLWDTAKQLAARRNRERVKSILLLAIPDEYLLKFHNVADAKSLWEAIKSSAPISKEDINQKFLRSLPSSWNQIALIMRNKPDIDEIDIDDIYNNLRVYKDELKSTASGDFGVSIAGGINQVLSTPCAHDIMIIKRRDVAPIIMAPKQMTQAAIAKLVSDEVAKALAEDRATRNTTGAGGPGNVEGAGNAGGPERAQQARDCTFSSFMKCGPTQFHGKEGAIELCRWFEKMESTFGISECAERNKVKFAAATLQGRALTWWNTQVATLGLAEANGKSWDDMKKMMLEEFCPEEE